MSPANEDDGRPGAAQDGPGVLANLPRTRPQRSSPRRAAARRASAENAAANGHTGVTMGSAPSTAATKPPPKRKAAAKRNAPVKRAPDAARRGAATPRARRGAARAGAVAADRAPVQGFECDGDRASGPVQPPGGSEFAASAAEIVTELTKAGFATGERLLKDVLARLPLS